MDSPCIQCHTLCIIWLGDLCILIDGSNSELGVVLTKTVHPKFDPELIVFSCQISKKSKTTLCTKCASKPARDACRQAFIRLKNLFILFFKMVLRNCKFCSSLVFWGFNLLSIVPNFSGIQIVLYQNTSKIKPKKAILKLNKY